MAKFVNVCPWLERVVAPPFWASPRPVDLPSMGSLGEAVLRRQRQLQEALRALLSDAEQAQAPLAHFHPVFKISEIFGGLVLGCIEATDVCK